MIQYPTWRYHASHEPRVITCADDEPGEGWHDAPVPLAPADDSDGLV